MQDLSFKWSGNLNFEIGSYRILELLDIIPMLDFLPEWPKTVIFHPNVLKLWGFW